MKNNKLTFMIFVSIMILSVLFISGCGGDDSPDTDAVQAGVSDDITDDKTDNSTEYTTDIPVTDDITDTEEAPDTTDTDTDTTAPDDIVSAPEFFNPLTGLPSETDLSTKRPVAIMINNIKKATPQHGIIDADIIYECLAEGGITRLLMLSTEYEKLGITGSVRSSRHYYINFAQDFDAIYIHAGGSPMAYDAISERNINNIDGVKYAADTFYRDEWRLDNMGYEHSLMTTGERLVAGIKYKKYRTTIKDGYKNPLNFCEYGTRLTLDGDDAGDAANIILKYSNSQTVDLTYDAATDKYLRYQFSGKPHIDNNTGEQLSFDNVIIILTDLWAIKGDESGRLEVITTGSGEGYYATGGKYIKIKWSKSDGDTPITYTDESGAPLIINRGKTFISVFDRDYKYSIK